MITDTVKTPAEIRESAETLATYAEGLALNLEVAARNGKNASMRALHLDAALHKAGELYGILDRIVADIEKAQAAR